MPAVLTDEALEQGLRVLAGRDADLAHVLASLGAPPMWARAPGFPTLVQIILEQQVSLASARAAFDRLQAAVAPLTPERFLALGDEALKKIGFSRQKTGYARQLARALAGGQLDLEALAAMDDEPARAALLKLKGIGPWSADIYLLMALRRADIWPAGDLALAVAVQHVKRLPRLPSRAELEALGMEWRPWRAVAARILWHCYLGEIHRGKRRRKQNDWQGKT